MMRLAPLVLLLSCTNGRTTFECDEETPCATVGEVCLDGFCQEARCATSAQCPMESYCTNGQCLLGCVEDSDCYPGSICDVETTQCVEEACTDTQVDCGYREFCNSATGDCYDAGDQYCKFCNDDEECASGICYAHYCTVDCSDGQECPSGFECYAFADSTGNISTYQCFTYCWLYEGYEPGAFVKEGQPLPVGPIILPESSNASVECI